MDTNKKLVLAFAAVAIGLLLYPPTSTCGVKGCTSAEHSFLWSLGAANTWGAHRVDLTRLTLYGLALAIAAGVTYFIRKK